MANPFDIVSAELMELSAVGREFVRNHTEYAKLAAHSHTIVWGSRGSGKSIHFRFLEPLAQAHRPESTAPGDVRRFLEGSDAFLGVYINCREGLLNREEFRQVERLTMIDENYIGILFSRYMSCATHREIIRVMREQLPWTQSTPVETQSVPVRLKALLSDQQETLGSFLTKVDDYCVGWLATLRELIDEHFLLSFDRLSRDRFPSNAPDVLPDLIDFCSFIQQAAEINVPIFLLYDEANELSTLQQQSINSLVGCRCQRILCVKIASQLHGFSPKRRFKADVDETHDYTTIDLESLYTSHQEAYYQRIRDIASQRLLRAGVNVEVNEYLPPNPKDLDDMEKARRLAGERYYLLPESKRPEDKTNFIKKYAPALVFQEVRSPKAGKSYAGFDNVVHLSSGIVRAFLDCCSRMYIRFVEANPEIEPHAIPISIQNEVIADYSDDFINTQILSKIDGLDPSQPERLEFEQLHSLLDGLGMLFRERLLDSSSREPRIISVSLKDRPDETLKRILRLAEREAFLHRKWYRSKRGNRNLPCYVLNRRLCPHYNLDLSGFQGRLELTAAQLSLALTDGVLLVQALRGDQPSESDGASQLSLFEW